MGGKKGQRKETNERKKETFEKLAKRGREY